MLVNKLKEYFFKKLYSELSHVEIIPYNGFIWFIDRENKHWYFCYNIKDERLIWRYGFFTDFFRVYGFDSNSFTPIISSWVKEVLNCKVNTTSFLRLVNSDAVEEVLNHKVNTTEFNEFGFKLEVNEVLNHKVSSQYVGK